MKLQNLTPAQWEQFFNAVQKFVYAIKEAQANDGNKSYDSEPDSTAAFMAAEDCGWSWDNSEHFRAWELKATNKELLTEGLRLFLESYSEPVQVQAVAKYLAPGSHLVEAWEVFARGKTLDIIVEESKDHIGQKVVASVCTQNFTYEEAVAIGNLIGAAPEMANALKALVNWMDDSDLSKSKSGGKGPFSYEGTEYSVVTDARKALVKAGCK